MSQDKRRQRGFSRRKFMQSAAASAAVAASGTMIAGPAQAKAKTPHLDPDVILLNGRIHTMDGNATVASSVAIKDGRFMEVERGRAHIRPGPRTRLVDLQGRTVVPGIIDNHNHLVLMGNRPGFHTPLENAHSIAEALAIYAARVREVPAGAWITTIGGFHSNHLYANPADPLSGRLPTLAELDSVAPNNPVFIEIGFTGPSATNSAGKTILQANGVAVGVTGDAGSIAGGTQSSTALLYLRQNLLNPETRRRGTLDAMKYAVSLGVTTHIDQGAFQATNSPADGAAHEDNFTMHFPFLEVYEQGQGLVRLRINFLHMEGDVNTPELVQRLKNAFPFFGNDMVKTGGIGEFIAQGTNPVTQPQFLQAARRVAAAKWRAEVHSLGRRQNPTSNPADFEFEIMAFEAVEQEFPGVIRDKRWVIAHVPGITQEWIDRWEKIGGNLSLTGWQFLAGNPVTSTVAPYAGPPFRMIVDSGRRPGGIKSGLSSDGMQIAPMNPWIHMYYATTGRNARNVEINAGQQINREEALELYTRSNGWFVREENDLGSIEVGKFGDLVVLDRDYFTVPNDQLKRIRSLMTIVGGNIVHDAGVLRVERERDDED
ncbi:MAG TPA: amidohydrolase family protein [Burkholderiales bacterium]|nr:amidohydrolase family protein [Burkholderiales bacterium]